MRFLRILALVALCFALAPAPGTATAATGFDSAYAGESDFVMIQPGQTQSFQVFFRNTGTSNWGRGSSTQVDLAACLEDKVTCNQQDASEADWNSGWLSAVRYTTHTQTLVTPGQVATFAYNIKAPANATGTHRFNGDLVVAQTGERIHPEGYFQDATIEAIGTVPGPTPTPTPTPAPTQRRTPSPTVAPTPTPTVAPTPTPTIAPTPTPTATPTPTPTPTPELGTLVVQNREGEPDVTICADNNPQTMDIVFVGAGLAPTTSYVLRNTRVDASGTFDTPVTTDAGGSFTQAFPADGAEGTWTAVVLSGDTPVTNPVTFTFQCDPVPTPTPTPTIAPTPTPTATPTPTPTPTPELGTLVVQNREGEPDVTICADNNPETNDIVFVGAGLAPTTSYVLRNTQVGGPVTFDTPVTTDSGGSFTQAFPADGAEGTWTAVVLTSGGTPVTNPVTFTFQCDPVPTPTPTPTIAPTPTPTATPTPTPTPTPALGTLVVQNSAGEPDVTICADGNPETTDITFVGSGLAANTTYTLRNTPVSGAGSATTFDTDVTTGASGNFTQSFPADGGTGIWEAEVLDRDTETMPATNPVTFTFQCEPT